MNHNLAGIANLWIIVAAISTAEPRAAILAFSFTLLLSFSPSFSCIAFTCSSCPVPHSLCLLCSPLPVPAPALLRDHSGRAALVA